MYNLGGIKQTHSNKELNYGYQRLGMGHVGKGKIKIKVEKIRTWLPSARRRESKEVIIDWVQSFHLQDKKSSVSGGW